MERPHYRRVTGDKTPSGLNRGRGHDRERTPLSERLVAQFIICGIIMALILVINLIDTSLAQSITAGVKSVIQDQPTADDVKQVLTNASDTARTIFGNTVNDQGADNFNIVSDAWIYSEEGSEGVAETTPGPADFRIDEDILTQIQAESGGQ